MPGSGNPHDQFLKAVLARREITADILMHYLPAEVARDLDFSTLIRREGTFVDPNLRSHMTDLMFEVRRHEGSPARVYVLFEHKSTPDRLVTYQLLRYLVNIWGDALKEQPSPPPVVPLDSTTARSPGRPHQSPERCLKGRIGPGSTGPTSPTSCWICRRTPARRSSAAQPRRCSYS